MESQKDFDISNLTLKELIETLEVINSFIVFLEDSKIEEEGANSE